MTYQNEQSKILKNLILRRMAFLLIAFSAIYAILFVILDVLAHSVFSDVLYTVLTNNLNLYFVYDFIASSYAPVLTVGYLAGIVAIIWSCMKRSVGYFDLLLSSIGDIVEDKDELTALPQELSHTALALREMQTINRRNQMAATAAEQRKNELVVYLAHDIKTPLTSIIGYLSLLSESPDMPLETRARYAGIALDKAYRLEELIEEFFEITRYNLQHIPIERSRFDATLFCQQVIDDLYPQSCARSLTLTLKAPEHLEVFADANRLSRALDNIMKNALSYADEKSEVTVSAQLCTLRETEQWFKIEVNNRGREISPERLERLFEKFYRGDDSRSTTSGGSGLGLAISREIARAHDGDITAASEQGWTSFALWIPQGRTTDTGIDTA